MRCRTAAIELSFAGTGLSRPIEDLAHQRCSLEPPCPSRIFAAFALHRRRMLPGRDSLIRPRGQELRASRTQPHEVGFAIRVSISLANPARETGSFLCYNVLRGKVTTRALAGSARGET